VFKCKLIRRGQRKPSILLPMSVESEMLSRPTLLLPAQRQARDSFHLEALQLALICSNANTNVVAGSVRGRVADPRPKKKHKTKSYFLLISNSLGPISLFATADPVINPGTGFSQKPK
jgi:hypothetical protein